MISKSLPEYLPEYLPESIIMRQTESQNGKSKWTVETEGGFRDSR